MGTFCQDTANIWRIVGYMVLILKIVIPVILIVLGMVDLGKAVISSDDKAISKAVGTLSKRFIAAVIIFFVPSIVSAIFKMVTGTALTATGSDTNICVQCVTNVTSKKPLNNTGKSCIDLADKIMGLPSNDDTELDSGNNSNNDEDFKTCPTGLIWNIEKQACCDKKGMCEISSIK